MHLVKLIDIAAEDIKMPGYLAKHIKSEYWDPNRMH